ncbi:MAG: hypothetical protein ACLFSC_12235 [Wenzhouxiangella sp.]
MRGWYDRAGERLPGALKAVPVVALRPGLIGRARGLAWIRRR